MTTQQANRSLRDTLMHLCAARQSMPSDASVTAANHALDDVDEDLDRCIAKVTAAVEIVSDSIAADVERAEARIVNREAA